MGLDCSHGAYCGGYTIYLENAGTYSLRQIRAEPDYYHDGDGAYAIPCGWVSREARRVVRIDHNEFLRMTGKTFKEIPV